MVSYRSYILGYGVGPIERKTGGRELAEFIRGHCASAMRLKAMAITAYEKIGTLMILPQYLSAGTVLYTSLTAAISSLDSLGCVLWGLLNGNVRRSHHPDMLELSRWLKRRGAAPMNEHIGALINSSWYRDLKLARDSLVHRGCWPLVTNDGKLVFAPRPGIFSKEFGESDTPNSFEPDEVVQVDLPQAMVGFLVGLEDWEKAISADLANHSRYDSFMSNGLLITASIDQENLLVDPFLTEQFIKTGTVEYREWFKEQKAVTKNKL